MAREISEHRKTLYYIGMGMQILGGVLFASTFVSFLIHFGDFTDFESRARNNGLTAFVGMALLIIGGVMRSVGARGLAGSGVVLNPGQAREELEPYSRMAGGMVKDAIEESDINISNDRDQVIMIRCRSCEHLNPEKAKYCQECGEKL